MENVTVYAGDEFKPAIGYFIRIVTAHGGQGGAGRRTPEQGNGELARAPPTTIPDPQGHCGLHGGPADDAVPQGGALGKPRRTRSRGEEHEEHCGGDGDEDCAGEGVGPDADENAPLQHPIYSIDIFSIAACRAAKGAVCTEGRR